jgi:hypothetical protein
MSVYVGVPMWEFRGMIMCHMVADTEKELDAMAFELMLEKEWKQEPKRETGIGSLVHYDISKSKRNEAIKMGAIPLDDLYAEVDVLDRLANRPRKKHPKVKAEKGRSPKSRPLT